VTVLLVVILREAEDLLLLLLLSLPLPVLLFPIQNPAISTAAIHSTTVKRTAEKSPETGFWAIGLVREKQDSQECRSRR
jgi:hypothetical protein